MEGFTDPARIYDVIFPCKLYIWNIVTAAKTRRYVDWVSERLLQPPPNDLGYWNDATGENVEKSWTFTYCHKQTNKWKLCGIRTWIYYYKVLALIHLRLWRYMKCILTVRWVTWAALEIMKLQGATLSLIHIWRCRRIERCRSRWSPYH